MLFGKKERMEPGFDEGGDFADGFRDLKRRRKPLDGVERAKRLARRAGHRDIGEVERGDYTWVDEY